MHWEYGKKASLQKKEKEEEGEGEEEGGEEKKTLFLST